METRASYTLIGAFVLVFVAALFVFVFWLARSDIELDTRRYVSYFQESVSGLGIGAAVRYRGLKVGSVTNMRVDPVDPTRVVVEMDVDNTSPIREGDVASLQIQGITGLAFIEIQGAGPDDPVLTAAPGRDAPVIPSGPSEIAKLISGAPALIDNANILVGRVSELFKEDNRVLIEQMLADLSALTESFASRRAHIERVIDALDDSRDDIASMFASLRDTANKLNTVADRLNNALDRTGRLVETDAPAAFQDIEEAAEALNGLLSEIHTMVKENREPVQAFTGEGLTEIMRFIQDARLLTAGISRVLDRFESEGARFLLGNRDSGVNTQR
jgi:phospholipid/cholesterol/gamma-HCH transport system substrate-binding protein